MKEKKLLQTRIEEVFRLFPEIEQRKNADAGDLSGGEKQMLALGRALMLRPNFSCSTSLLSGFLLRPSRRHSIRSGK